MTDKKIQYINNAPFMSVLNQVEDEKFIFALKILIKKQKDSK